MFYVIISLIVCFPGFFAMLFVLIFFADEINYVLSLLPYIGGFILLAVTFEMLVKKQYGKVIAIACAGVIVAGLGFYGLVNDVMFVYQCDVDGMYYERGSFGGIGGRTGHNINSGEYVYSESSVPPAVGNIKRFQYEDDGEIVWVSIEIDDVTYIGEINHFQYEFVDADKWFE